MSMSLSQQNDFRPSLVISSSRKDEISRRIQSFKRREMAFIQSNTIWQIVAGVVRVSTWDEDGEIIPLGFAGENDVIGLPFSHVTPYQVDCLTDVEVHILPSIDSCPAHAIVSHIQQMEALLRMMHSCSMEQRLLLVLA
jgi:hypothetical protein